MITELRNQNQLKVGAGIESFTKRTVIRNLKDTAMFSKEDVAILYDKYFGALYYASHEASNNAKSDSKMNREVFQSMLASMTVWAKAKHNTDNADVNAANAVCNNFIDRMYRLFTENAADNLLDFQMVILGMNEILHGVSVGLGEEKYIERYVEQHCCTRTSCRTWIGSFNSTIKTRTAYSQARTLST